MFQVVYIHNHNHPSPHGHQVGVCKFYSLSRDSALDRSVLLWYGKADSLPTSNHAT